jgi:uncharacterized protein YkwD
MARIRVDDLPVADNLTPEQEALIAGAGLRSFRPTLESLETREVMSANFGEAPVVPPPANNTFEYNVVPQHRTDAPRINIDAGDTASEVLYHVNQERRNAGQPDLVVAPALTRAAQGYARFLAQKHNDLVKLGYSDTAARKVVLPHQDARDHRQDGREPWDRAKDEGFPHNKVGEVIHAGPRVNAEEAVRGIHNGKGFGWMYSPGHRDAILNPKYTLAGMGVHYTDSGNPYYVLKLAEPR